MSRIKKYCLVTLASITLIAHLQGALVHRFTFDETFQHSPLSDIAGGSTASSTPLERGLVGVWGGAVGLDGSELDAIDLGSAASLLPSGSLTVCFWVKLESGNADNAERLLDFSDGGALTEITSGINFMVQDDALKVIVGDGINKAGTDALTPPVNEAEWTLVILRYQPSSDPGVINDGQIQLTSVPLGNSLIDPAEVSSQTVTLSHAVGNPTNGNTSDLYLGAPTGTASSPEIHLDGRVDDLRIYDHALDDSEIATLHNELVPVAGGLRWIFNVAGDQEGWTTLGISASQVTGGNFRIISGGGDPHVISPDNLGLGLTWIQKVYVKVKNGSSSTAARIYFQTDSNPSFSQASSVLFTVTANDSVFQTYEIDMSTNANWTGTLKRLRLDIPDQGDSSGSEILIDRIAVGESGNRPNIIVMMADDLGWKDVAFNGSTFFQTPNLDSFAASGLNYPNAHTPSPACSPVRAAILTGLYPARLRFTSAAGHVADEILDPQVFPTTRADSPATQADSRTRLPNGYVTYADLLKKAGYSTAFIGKWHLGRDEYIPENQGFDFVVGGREAPAPPGRAYPGSNSNTPGYFAPFKSGLNMPTNWPDGTPIAQGDHMTDVLAAYSADFIENNRHRPFLMNVWWYGVHSPFDAKESLRDDYVGLSSTDGRQRSETMAAMIEVLDDGSGVILDKLDELGLSDDTVVIFTSDNGGMMYQWLDEDVGLPTDNYPARAGKATVWDGGTRVPFVIRWPGVTDPNTSNEDVFNTHDIYTTILEMAEVAPYDGYPLDSLSLTPSIQGQAPANNRTTYGYIARHPLITGNRPSAWVRQGDMKLIRFFHGNGAENDHRYELYNIALDPSETNNLADYQPALVTTLDALLEQYLVDTEALIPAYNPNYIPPVFDGWTENNEVWTFKENNGVLRMLATGSLPALYSPDMSALPTPASVRLVMASRSYGDGAIWWKRPGDFDWSIGRSVGFEVTHDNVMRTINVAINPGSTVEQIRFQPSSGYFETDIYSLEVLDATGQAIQTLSLIDSDGDGLDDLSEAGVLRDSSDPSDLGFEFPFEGDTMGWEIRDIANFVSQNSVISGTNTSTDPQLYNNNFNFAGDEISNLYLRYKASSNGTVAYFFGNAVNPGFNGARRINLSYTGAGGWQMLTIPVSTSASAAEWNGQTITSMRLDPGAEVDGKWEIDWLRASDGDADGDGIDDLAEGFPGRDSDGDGLEDWIDRDSDNDLISDAVEFSNGTDPYNDIESTVDTDGDSYSDRAELLAGTSRTDPNDFPLVPIETDSEVGRVVFYDEFGGPEGDSLISKADSFQPGFTNIVSRNTALDGQGRLQSSSSTDSAAGYRFKIATEALTASAGNLAISWSAKVRMPTHDWMAIGFNRDAASHFLDTGRDTGPFLRFTSSSTWISPGSGISNQIEILDTHTAGEIVEVEMVYYPATQTIDVLFDGQGLVADVGITHLDPSGTPSAPVIDHAQIQLRLQETVANGGAYIDDFCIKVIDSGRILYSRWAASWPGLEANPERHMDPDGDGLVNLLEYAYGDDPTSPTPFGDRPTSATVEDNGTAYFEFSYPERTDAFQRGLAYSLLDKESLMHDAWQAVVEEDRGMYEINRSAPVDGFNWVTSRVPLPLSQSRFFQLRVAGAASVPELWTCMLPDRGEEGATVEERWAYADPARVDQWEQVRSADLKVLKLYIDRINEIDSASLQNMASIASEYDLDISVEIGGIGSAAVVNRPDDIGGVSFEFEFAKLQKYTDQGGTITYLSMDDPIRRFLYPIVGGEVVTNQNITLSEGNAEIVKAMQRYREIWPEVKFIYLTNFPNWGWDGGPAYVNFDYNGNDPQGRGDFKAAFQDLYKQATQAGIEFYGLSADNPYSYYTNTFLSNQPAVTAGVDWPGRLLELERFAEERGMNFILIVNDQNPATAAEFKNQVVDYITAYRESGGTPHAYMIQSWYTLPQRILPESQPNTMTNIILEALDAF